jgi:hypothetical protein
MRMESHGGMILIGKNRRSWIKPCPSSIKYSRATSRVSWLSGKKNNFSRTISVLVFRVLTYLENQSASDIGLPEFHAHDGVLANGSCWLVSKA